VVRRQFRLVRLQELLELPAGLMEKNEPPEISRPGASCVKKIGMAANELRELGQFYMAAGYSSEYMYIYLATGLSPSPLEQDEDEFFAGAGHPGQNRYMRWYTPTRSTTAKPLAALLLAEPFLK